MRWIPVAVFASCLLFGALPTLGEQPDFSGTWKLDVESSDDVQDEFRRWMQARRLRGGPGGVGAGGAGGRGDGGGGRAGSGQSGAGAGGDFGRGAGGGRGRALLGMMRQFLRGSERLEIEHGDPELTITTATGQARTVFTDGRVIEREEENGGKTKVKTRWKKQRLVVDVAFPRRPNPLGGTLTPNLTQTYSLDKTGRLEMQTTVSLGAGIRPFTVERIYTKQE